MAWMKKGLLEVGVNDTSRREQLDAPLRMVHCRTSSSPVVKKLPRFKARRMVDDLRQTGLGAQSLALSLSGHIVVHQGVRRSPRTEPRREGWGRREELINSDLGRYLFFWRM